ncbi:nucleotidyltransferase domain-containing protein [Streptomyces sp. Act143]|uniref:nucleotidyltransferase domain-containing protein n=1 Tax=Streptomyces sp. Act143 TaxID=2200760 RepID=UPI0035C1F6AE
MAVDVCPPQLHRADVDVCIRTGWGVDALIGEQTCQQRDLDEMHRQGQRAAVVAAFTPGQVSRKS